MNIHELFMTLLMKTDFPDSIRFSGVTLLPSAESSSTAIEYSLTITVIYQLNRNIRRLSGCRFTPTFRFMSNDASLAFPLRRLYGIGRFVWFSAVSLDRPLPCTSKTHSYRLWVGDGHRERDSDRVIYKNRQRNDEQNLKVGRKQTEQLTVEQTHSVSLASLKTHIDRQTDRHTQK